MSTAKQEKESLQEIEQYFDQLWPLNRSLTGEGVRQTHAILSELVDLETIEVPSGTQVFDWIVPQEWKVHSAYLLDPAGEKILDVEDNNLHLMGYSTPFRGKMNLLQLNEHLYSLPDQPTAIPYVTSYYKPRWGFCLTDQQRSQLIEGEYEVVIDTELNDGSMTISEAILPSTMQSEGDILFSTYTCHPSLANNELSGPLAAAFLYQRLKNLPDRRYNYRFVFVPETIGAIAYLAKHGEHLKTNLVAGYVLTCLGLPKDYIYKRSRRGNALPDRVAEHVLEMKSSGSYTVKDFYPSGSDERQYCSPGFNLPVGSLLRGAYNEYPEYHTSLDNKELLCFKSLQETIDLYEQICMVLERNGIYSSCVQNGEPHFMKWGVASTMEEQMMLQWIVNMGDVDDDLLSLSQLSGYPIENLYRAAEHAVEQGLLKRLNQMD